MSYQEIPTDDEIDATDDLWAVNGFEIKEHFFEPVPHVMGEKVVQLKALPPSSWSI